MTEHAAIGKSDTSRIMYRDAASVSNRIVAEVMRRVINEETEGDADSIHDALAACVSEFVPELDPAEACELVLNNRNRVSPVQYESRVADGIDYRNLDDVLCAHAHAISVVVYEEAARKRLDLALAAIADVFQTEALSDAE